jgi:hypothetical protein
LPRTAGSTCARWGRWRSCAIGGSLTFDLNGLVLHHRFRGLEDPTPLLSGRVRLLLDPLGRRVWLDGERIDVPQKAENQWNLLVALAQRPGALLARPGAYQVVFPEDYLPRRINDFDWKKRLGDIWRDLKKHARWPVTLTPGDYQHGGYTLNLAKDEVAWWTEPAPLAQPARAVNRAR